MLVAVNFHYVRENYNLPFKAIHGLTPDIFRLQIEQLSKEGEFVSSDQITDHLQNGSKLHDKAILITFDDGLKEQYEIALSILDELGVPAIFYVNPYNISDSKVSNVHQIHLLRSFVSASEILLFLEKTGIDLKLSKEEEQRAVTHYNYDIVEDALLKYTLNFKLNFKIKEQVINDLFNYFFSLVERLDFHNSLYMNLEMVKSLSSRGYLGSHTFSHQPLAFLSSLELFQEFEKTDKFFKTNLIKSPKSISYPYGSKESCSQEVIEVAKDYHFAFGFTMERAGNKCVMENSLQLARFDCNDVLGGKSSLFKSGEMFEKTALSKWRY